MRKHTSGFLLTMTDRYISCRLGGGSPLTAGSLVSNLSTIFQQSCRRHQVAALLHACHQQGVLMQACAPSADFSVHSSSRACKQRLLSAHDQQLQGLQTGAMEAMLPSAM